MNYECGENIGEIGTYIREANFKWKISQFFDLPEEVGIWYYSPEFSLCDNLWVLQIFPNGFSDDGSSGRWIAVYLVQDCPPKSVTFSLGILKGDGTQEILAEEQSFTFSSVDDFCGKDKFLDRCELLKHQSVLVPEGTLTLTCTLKSDQQHLEDGVDLLAQNLKELFLSGQNSDVVVTVEDKEFKLHRAILGARSPVLASMFQHDMKEKNSGVVDIPDCSFEAFEVFLLYIYTGKVDAWSPDTVLDVYYAADKYGVGDLKKRCVKFMKSSLSVDNFCGIVGLSLRHNEAELLETATRFFCHNAKVIIKTAEWQRYLKENPVYANELYIKALDAVSPD